MHYAAPTSTLSSSIAHILALLERREQHALAPSDADGGGGVQQVVPEAAQLKAQLLPLQVALRKVEAKIHGGIRPADWERLNPDLERGKQVLDRVLKLALGSAAAWEPLDDDSDRALTPVQSVAECRAAFEAQ